MHKSRIVIVVAAVVGALGTFLPWATVGIVQVAGTEGWGWYTLGLFAIALLAGISGRHRHEIDPAMRIFGGVMAAGALAIAVYVLVRIHGFHDPDGLLQLETGPGIYLICIAAIVLIATFIFGGRGALEGVAMLIIGSAIIAWLAYWAAGGERHRTTSPAPTADPWAGSDSAAGIVHVSSDELQDVYSTNAVRGDELYKGKVLEVTGAIQSIGNGFDEIPYVELWTRDEFAGIRARFQRTSGLSSLAKGQHVTVRCIGDGMTVTSPELRDCVLLTVR